MKTAILTDRKEDIIKAGQIIKDGGLVAFPTETVYGLGADALNEEAVRNVYLAKGRPQDNPMIVHISHIDDLKALTTEITEPMRVLAEKFWPGPMTMIVKKSQAVPYTTTGGLETVGVRMPNNDVALSLIRESGKPIAAPSANLSGKPSPTRASHVIDDLDGRIDAIIVSLNCDVGIESTVIDVTGPVPLILRPGVITREEFQETLGMKVFFDPTLNRRPEDGLGDFKPKAPGMKYKHYAPKAEMIIFSGKVDKVKEEIEKEKKNREEKGQKVEVLLFEEGDERLAARDFFARLREADKAGVDVILAESLKEEGIGFSVMNRMLKSAGYNIRNV